MRIQSLYTPVSYSPDNDYTHLAKLLEMLSQQPHFPNLPGQTQSTCKVELSPNGKRIRNPVIRGNLKVTWKLPSEKNGREIQCESKPEFDGFRILEACPFVISYLEQPGKIHFKLNGKAHWHIPDALIELKNGRLVFIEIKPDSVKHDPELAARTRVLTRELPGLGYQYLVVIQVQTGGIPQENAHTLLKDPWPSVDIVIQENIRKTLRSLGNTTIDQLLDNLPQQPEYTFAINRLMLTGKIRYDVYTPITGSSDISWN